MGEITDFAPITCGVPQGTIAGPVVFVALVNSLCQEVRRRAKFLDDLSTANIISTLNEIIYPMQQDLNNLTTQCTDKGMKINADK